MKYTEGCPEPYIRYLKTQEYVLLRIQASLFVRDLIRKGGVV